MRYALKKDANQAEIVQALERIGCTVFVMHQPCDLLVGKAGRNVLIEVKDGDKPPSARKLTKAQVEFRKIWRGQFATAINVDQALAIVAEAMR